MQFLFFKETGDGWIKRIGEGRIESSAILFRGGTKAGGKFGEVPARSTDFSESRVWLQNVDKPVRMEGYPYHEDWDYYQGDDWIVMDVNVFSDNAGGLPNDTAPTVYGDRTLGVRQSGVNTIYYWKDRHLFEILVYKGASSNINDAFARLVEQM